MFRDMRRSEQSLSTDSVTAVMERCTNGILACLGDEDYPYAVPLSFVYLQGRIYFHTAKYGHKVDAIAKHPKVSFALVDDDTIVSAEYTTHYRSVIAFGQARLVEGDERLQAFAALIEKYSGDRPEREKQEKVAGCSQSRVMAIDIERITGKESIEYVNAGR